MDRQTSIDRKAIRDEAAAWVVRLEQTPDAPECRARFDAWLRASPHHQVAYEREAATWERLDRLRALRPAPHAFPQLTTRAAKRLPPLGRWPRGWAVAASAVLALGIGSVAPVMLLSSPAYATGVGERRLVVLRDGSQVELNTDTKVVVKFGPRVREVRVIRGEAVFHVADGSRPFMIVANDVKVSARSATTEVRVDDGRSDITAVKGLVHVESAEGEARGRLRLSPGTEAKYASGGGPTIKRLSSEGVDRSLAWRHGAIALNGETLAEAAAEFNRYSRRKIHLADSSIAHLRVAGYFRANDPGGFSAALTRTFPVRVDEGSNGEIYLYRRD